MDKDYADEMYGNNSEPQYRCVEVRKYPWCRGCDDQSMTVTVTEYWSDDKLEREDYIIHCEFERTCRSLAKRILDR